MLENSRSLFNKSAAVLRAGLQHTLESPLTHDHVHLTTETGVAQQLLKVEQAARLTVDGVLTRSVTKQGAADGDFGVLDGQRAVGVVDCQRDLGATERSAGGRTGKDDVFQLSAAQCLSALLPHHPGEGVDHVRLSRTVGSHHAGNALFEGKSCGLRERLEALEGQAFQVHGTTFRRRHECGG